MKKSLIHNFCCLVATIWFCGLFSGASFGQIQIDWVTVGNPGNSGASGDSNYGEIGAVDYIFDIAKHEVTNGQYATFLNAVAKADPNNLYSTEMATSHTGGILRSGTSGNYTYATKANFDNKPVNWVSFFDAMRFTNWMENGQLTGAQSAATTEAGVYAIVSGGAGLAEVRNPNASYFLPDQNEWYKAAFHKNDGVTGNYNDYATGSSVAPIEATADSSGDVTNPGPHTVTYGNYPVRNGGFNFTTVGSGQSESSYGTFDQNGNVEEWSEGLLDQFNMGSSNRSLWGEGASISSLHRTASRNADASHVEWRTYGFRLAGNRVVPEPGSLFIFGIASAFVLSQRRRRAC